MTDHGSNTAISGGERHQGKWHQKEIAYYESIIYKRRTEKKLDNNENAETDYEWSG